MMTHAKYSESKPVSKSYTLDKAIRVQNYSIRNNVLLSLKLKARCRIKSCSYNVFQRINTYES